MPSSEGRSRSAAHFGVGHHQYATHLRSRGGVRDERLFACVAMQVLAKSPSTDHASAIPRRFFDTPAPLDLNLT